MSALMTPDAQSLTLPLSDLRPIPLSQSLNSSHAYDERDPSGDEDEIVWSPSSQLRSKTVTSDGATFTSQDGEDLILLCKSLSLNSDVPSSDNHYDYSISSAKTPSTPGSLRMHPMTKSSDAVSHRIVVHLSTKDRFSRNETTSVCVVPSTIASQVETGVASGCKKRRRRRKSAHSQDSILDTAAAKSYPSPCPTPSPTTTAHSTGSQVPVVRRSCSNKVRKPSSSSYSTRPQSGLGRRSVVDDMSENGDVTYYGTQNAKEFLLSTAYDEAVNFMNNFILHPSYYTSKASRLTFLQALIIELGICHQDIALPNTLTSAKSLLRAHAFLNVRDYLAVRTQGVEALREAMYPSRRSLVRDLRQTKTSVRDGGRAPLGWVKETGLTVFLVHCA